MGNGYGEVLGIIIAAGVFAAGLKASGLIAVFIEVLRGSNEIARWGGSLGPFVMGVITGSGDAAAFAFNEAVTPHAPSFGMAVPTLGTMAALAGAPEFGRFRQIKSSQLFDYQRVQSFFNLLSCVHARACP